MSLTKVTYSMIQGAVTNVLDYIPPAEHAAILDGTSTYNCAADIQTAIAIATIEARTPNSTIITRLRVPTISAIAMPTVT